MRHSVVVLGLSLLSVGALGCDPQRDWWGQALRDCGITDVNPANTLYFGPSDNAGPGSGWRETFDRKRRHVDYRLRIDSEELPGPTAFIRPSPSGYQCKSGRDVTLKLDISVAVRVSTLPLSGELSDALKWAREIRITARGMGWDELNESDYEEYVRKTLGPGNRYYQEMNEPDRLVLRRALAVENLVMAYEFSKDDATWLKSKYQGPLGGQGSGEIGGGFSADWHDNGLTIIAPARAWILGELVPFKSSTGFDTGAAQDRAGMKIVPDSVIVAENQNRLAPLRRQ
jgi:hypothetical protein